MVDEFTSESMKNKTYPSVTDRLENPWENKGKAEIHTEATQKSVCENEITE